MVSCTDNKSSTSQISLEEFFNSIPIDKDDDNGIYKNYVDKYKYKNINKAYAVSFNKLTNKINWDDYAWGVSFDFENIDKAREEALKGCNIDAYKNEECIVIIENEVVISDMDSIMLSTNDSIISVVEEVNDSVYEEPYEERDYYRLDKCYYAAKYINNKSDATLYNAEIGNWKYYEDSFDSNDYEENSAIINIKTQTVSLLKIRTDEDLKETIKQDEIMCNDYGHCYDQAVKTNIENHFIQSYNYPSIETIPYRMNSSYTINLDKSSYVLNDILGKTLYQCQKSTYKKKFIDKKIYPYESLDIDTYGSWTNSLQLNEENGNINKYARDGIVSISLKPYPLSERGGDIPQISNEISLLLAKPEDLFKITLTDSGMNMFDDSKPVSKEFIGTVKDNQIIGVSIFDKLSRNLQYNYANADDSEKKLIDWKIRFLYTQKIYIDMPTGIFSWGRYRVSTKYEDKYWFQRYLDTEDHFPGLYYNQNTIAMLGAPLTFGGKGYVETFKMPDPDMIGKSNIFKDKNPDEVVQAASGSGFFINDSGYLVTNNHVVDGCSAMKVLIDGKEYQADVVATDNTNDIALLKSEFSNKDFFKINTEDVERSESVKAIGFGFGKSYSSDIKVTAGIVSSLAGFNDNYSEFQMDAAIQSGNSGGPVINESGDVVGMSVAALNSSAVFEETGTMPQNVNYAIKASTLKQFLDANNAEYKLSEDSWFSFGSASNSEINKKIDAAAVYLSCYMTYAEIEESMNKKAMFENVE